MATSQSGEDVWHMVRSKIQHEASWIQQQVSWHLASTAFLFSAYAILVVSVTSGVDKLPPAKSVLLLLIPTVGTIFSTLVYLGVVAAAREIGNALREWDTLGPGPEAKNRLPAIHLGRSALRLAGFSTTGISLTAIAMWLVLLAVSLGLVFGNGAR
jgi:hypothetical protein